MNAPSGRSIDAALQLLDRQLIDSHGRLAGKVDDVELTESEDDGSLLVTALLSGPGALAPRLQGTMGARWRVLCRRIFAGEDGEDGDPVRIPFGAVTSIDTDVHLSLSRDDLATSRTERWVRRYLISGIPGASDAPPE